MQTLLTKLLPGIDGYDMYRILKDSDNTRDIPVIFISSLKDPIDKVKVFSLGCVDYCSKPSEIDELTARVAIHITLYKAMKEAPKLMSPKHRHSGGSI